MPEVLKTFSPESLPYEKAPIQRINFADVCRSCGGCCEDENIFASAEELGKLEVLRIGKKRDGSCEFLKDGLCSVWRNRPLECVLFPFDFVVKNESVWWRIWRTCPSSPYIALEKSLLYFEEKVLPNYSPGYISDYLTHHSMHQPLKYSSMLSTLLRPVIVEQWSQARHSEA